MESRLGGYWASRLGIVSLVTGLAFFVAHGFDRMGPALKAATGYAIALALAGCGRWVTRRYQALGRILVAGGLGVGYYTTYAIHHVPSVQLIASPAIGVRRCWPPRCSAIIAIAQAMRSETVAGLALFLGLHTGMVSQVGVFTLASGCLLAAGAAFFVARNRGSSSRCRPSSRSTRPWSRGCSATRSPRRPASSTRPITWPSRSASSPSTTRRSRSPSRLAPSRLPRAAAAAFSLLNWAGAALVAVYELGHHGAGGIEIVFGILAATSLAAGRRGRLETGRALVFHLHLALVAVSLALAAFAALDGALLILALCVLGAAAAVLARVLESRALRAAGAAIVARRHHRSTCWTAPSSSASASR